MKKYILVLITGITFSTIQAQEIRDAVRYSQDNLNGTATPLMKIIIHLI
jgi:hypothetical protein